MGNWIILQYLVAQLVGWLFAIAHDKQLYSEASESYCEPFSISSGKLNNTICTFYTETSNFVVVSACSRFGGTCNDMTSDTYFVLYDEHGAIVAVNDDRCGLCSSITFTPSSATRQYYSLHQSCYADRVCQATTAISNGFVISTPTDTPTQIPKTPPTVEPTAQSTVFSPTQFPTESDGLIEQLEILWDLGDSTGGEDWNDPSIWGLLESFLDPEFSDYYNITIAQAIEYLESEYAIGFENGNVISIRLAGHNLVGTIPASICGLVHLRTVSLASNYITGTIPSCFLDRTGGLVQVILEGNFFSGAIPDTLNETVTQLNVLRLRSNLLTGTVPASLCALPSVTSVSMNDNMFSCVEMCTPVASGVYDYLSESVIHLCSWQQDQALCSLESALEINSRIPLTEGFETTFSVVGRFIESPAANGDFVAITDTFTLSEMDVLEYHVTFDQSILKGDARKYDPKNFPVNFVVRIGESYDGLSFEYYFYCGYCTTGKRYNISDGVWFVGSPASYPGTPGTGPFTSKHPFVTVDVYTVSGSYGLFAVPAYSFVVTELVDTSVSRWDCNNGREFVTNACDWYGISCDGFHVTKLSLSSMGLKGRIPAEINQLSTLQHLELAYNSISGTLPSALSSLPQLKLLDISSNDIIGEIPSAFAVMTLLQFLSLNSNKLNGTLPQFFGDLSQLDYLLLQSNTFEGEVPYAICLLSNTTVRLDGNEFACYQNCEGQNSSNVEYGNIDECSPTHSPTSPPPGPVPVWEIGLISTGAVVFVIFCCFLLQWVWLCAKQRQLYDEFPLHKMAINGTDITLAAVMEHLSTANCVVEGKTVLQLVLDSLNKPGKNINKEVLNILVENALCLSELNSKDDAEKVELRQASWSSFLQESSDVVVDTVRHITKSHEDHSEFLAFGVDALGRRFVDVASPQCRGILWRSLMLHSRFDLKAGNPLHKSATSLVVQATMMMLSSDEIAAEPGKGQNTKPVVLKFMKSRANFLSEVEIRQLNISAEYVIEIIESFDGDAKDENNTEFRRSACRKGYEKYPYCIVMEFADASLQRVINEQHIAGYDWDMIRIFTRSLCCCIAHIHSFGIVHGDVKPLNVVIVGNSARLIDFDASVRLGDDSGCEFMGFKFSSAYLPPEMFFERFYGKVVVKRFNKDITTGKPVGLKMQSPSDSANILESYEHPLGYTLARASPAVDMWSLGAILFLLCTGTTLFQANVEDNISEADMVQLARWTESYKCEKLNAIGDKYARNLLSLLLTKDPTRRLSPDRVLSHPFLTGKHPERMIGEMPKYDIFLSYRADADSALVKRLYAELQSRNIKVWLDHCNLLPGQPWESGFCDGLVNSSCFVCVLSRKAINHADKPWLSFNNLVETSRCDNVLLEWRLALELQERGLVNAIFPIFVGDVLDEDNAGKTTVTNYFPSGCHPNMIPDVSVASVEAKLREHLERQGLGLPYQSTRTVLDCANAITAHQGGFIRGDLDQAFDKVCAAIQNMVRQVKERQDTGASDSNNEEMVESIHGEASDEVQLLRAEISRLRNGYEDDRKIMREEIQFLKAELSRLNLKDSC